MTYHLGCRCGICRLVCGLTIYAACSICGEHDNFSAADLIVVLDREVFCCPGCRWDRDGKKQLARWLNYEDVLPPWYAKL